MKRTIKKARKVFHLKRRITVPEILYYIEDGWVLKGFNSTFLVKGDKRINLYTGCCFEVETQK